jgi:hypothetical protein
MLFACPTDETSSVSRKIVDDQGILNCVQLVISLLTATSTICSKFTKRDFFRGAVISSQHSVDASANLFVLIVLKIIFECRYKKKC